MKAEESKEKTRREVKGRRKGLKGEEMEIEGRRKREEGEIKERRKVDDREKKIRKQG